jgi:hypothetical protein
MMRNLKTLTPQPPLPEVEGEQERVFLSPSTFGRGVGVRVFSLPMRMGGFKGGHWEVLNHGE